MNTQSFDFICRRATKSEDATVIAKYIYLTDPYIYPSICQSYDDPDWIKLIKYCMHAPNDIFNVENIWLAEQESVTVGLVCVIPCGKMLTFAEGAPISSALKEGLDRAIKGYFQPLLSESAALDGYNVTNVCTDKALRRNGIGFTLLTQAIRMLEDAPIHLDVIASNEAALSVYRRAGFQIELEYNGFSGNETPLPCYHMIRKPIRSSSEDKKGTKKWEL